MRRFELSALAFVAFNALCAVLVFREQRSLLFACDDYPGPPGDCLEPYNFLWLSFLALIWILGALVLGAVAVVLYRRGIRQLSAPNPRAASVDVSERSHPPTGDPPTAP